MGNPISVRKLCYDLLHVRKEELLALVADADSYYKPYQQKKIRKDGTVKTRDIEPSIDYLKKVQRKIDRHILKPAMSGMPLEIMGGRPGVSVIKNARHHARSKALMKYDVQGFFPSIKYEHVYYVFRYRLNFCEEAATILSKLTTYPALNPHVPQGAPTSTSLAMFVLEPLCSKLREYALSHDMSFSIWVDDITVSGDKETLKKYRGHINHLVNHTPFTIHPDKDSGILQKGSKTTTEKGRRITGVTIDNTNRLTLGSEKLKSLRRRVTRSRKPNESLKGSLLFLRQVSPAQGRPLYHRYRTKHEHPK